LDITQPPVISLIGIYAVSAYTSSPDFAEVPKSGGVCGVHRNKNAHLMSEMGHEGRGSIWSAASPADRLAWHL
jgi:hypothetical protein